MESHFGSPSGGRSWYNRSVGFSTNSLVRSSSVAAAETQMRSGPSSMRSGDLRKILFVFCFSCAAQAQPVAFNLQTYPDSPISLMGYTATLVRIGSSRRQFVTVKNLSDRAISGMLLQQTNSSGERPHIIALERISIIIRPHESKRLSVNVDEAWSQVQASSKSGSHAEKPVLSIVVVDFVDGSTWRAPLSTASDSVSRQ